MCEKCFYEFLNSFIGGDSIEFAAEKMPNVESEYQAYETISFGVSGVYEDGNGNVNVLFSDGTTETSVCHPEDVYDLRRGIEVCILHKLLGGKKQYNDTMNAIVKEYKKAIEKRKNEAQAKALEERRRAKRMKRKEQLKARYEEKYKEKKVEPTNKQYNAEYINGLIKMLEDILSNME